MLTKAEGSVVLGDRGSPSVPGGGAASRAPQLSAIILSQLTRYRIYVILVAFCVGLTAASSHFLTVPNLLNVVQQSSVLGLISLGMLVVVITGNIDLTVGALLSLVGVVMAEIDTQGSTSLGILAGFAVAVLSGLVVGYLATRGRNLSIIVTLSMLTILEGISLLASNGQPVVGLSNALVWCGGTDVAGVPFSIFLFLGAAAVVWWFLSQTRIGREFYAVGGNPEASRLAGIPVKRRVKTAFIISALLAATAGLILLGQVASAQPIVGVGDELYAVGAVLIGGASVNGGVGNVGKTIAGVLILGLINDGINLLGVNAFVAYIVQGGVILTAILLDQWDRSGRRRP